MKEKISISFDVDGTLNDHFFGDDNPNKDGVKQLFKELHNSGEYNLYILTRRFGPNDKEKGVKLEHETVFKILEDLSIELPEENMIFTNRNYKFSYINNFGINIHLDDDSTEHQLIKRFSNCESIDVKQQNWRVEFDEIILKLKK